MFITTDGAMFIIIDRAEPSDRVQLSASYFFLRPIFVEMSSMFPVFAQFMMDSTY